MSRPQVMYAATNPASQPGSLWVWMPGGPWVKYLSSNGQQVTISPSGQLSSNAVREAVDPTGEFEAMNPAATVWQVSTNTLVPSTGLVGTVQQGGSYVLAAPVAQAVQYGGSVPFPGQGAPQYGGMGGGSIGSAQLAQLLLTMQNNTTFTAFLNTAAGSVGDATDSASLKLPMVQFGEAVMLPLQGNATASLSAIGATGSSSALLVLALGSNVVSTMVAAITTFNKAIADAAAVADQADAYNTLVTAINAAITQTSTNSLLAQVATGMQGSSTTALLGVLLSQNANAAFIAGNGGATTSTLAEVQAAVDSFASAFATWVQSQLTYALISQMAN